ncbi:hypothetical protein [Virgibacillus sp. SK37]|uniref:hypothetical protein n=1 Tax=Virgibacillus sp. SK37 TaxID=403957 RepID=UPI0004D0DCAE|nr:hypothetical protein [Virgibacillus sp. SK37]AIF45084.1 hypothetical protein X953_01350 [Virgibacillus sp. SK37]
MGTQMMEIEKKVHKYVIEITIFYVLFIYNIWYKRHRKEVMKLIYYTKFNYSEIVKYELL